MEPRGLRGLEFGSISRDDALARGIAVFVLSHVPHRGATFEVVQGLRRYVREGLESVACDP